MRTNRAGSSEALDRRERLVLQILPAVRDEAHVVVLRFDVVDPLDREDVDLRAVADQHALERPLDRTASRQGRRLRIRTALGLARAAAPAPATAPRQNAPRRTA